MPEMPSAPLFGQGGVHEREGSHSRGLSGGLFGHKEVLPPAGIPEVAGQLANISRRLRVLEERYDGLRKKVQLIEQNILKQNKSFNREFKTSNSDIVDLRRDLEDLKVKARLIVKELMGCAKTEDVQVLDRYINLWEPVNFVTRTEVEKIVDEAINRVLQENEGMPA